MATTAISPETAPRTAAWPRTLLMVGRVLLGLIFVIAAYTKLHFDGAWHFGDYHFFFAMAIDSYKLVPTTLAEWMARSLPWVELILGVTLISGVALRWAGLFASGLMTVFIVAMVHAYVLKLEIMCGCFGNNEKVGPLTLIRDSSLLVLALAVTVGAFLIKKRRDTVSS
ncbi:MAG TPA: MauE/DoxX family redox-associated membrane protein [Candidatus Acidoferrales bacterium]|nr:MauE/DoxX family redox-associated membrane protein [Candidatus Acidoferrales bacterium]